MRELVHALCSVACAGRAPGTPGGVRARQKIVEALRACGLDPAEQSIAGTRAANVIAALPGDIDRWVLVAAHYDHLGGHAGRFYPGADDNAAAIAILVDVARGIARRRPQGRGVLIAAFDAEEPPYFLTREMGSSYYADHAQKIGPPVERIDMMVCMDLVGHALGPSGLPSEVGQTLFALGAERSAGTLATVQSLAQSEPGLIVRPADAEIIPPLSDYDAFWRRRVPFLFLTAGRSARYHTVNDTPEFLDWNKMAATARWIERFVRAICRQPAAAIPFVDDARADATTLHSFIALAGPLAPVAPLARVALERAQKLLAACDEKGRLPSALRSAPAELILGLESALS
ncbi:MAG: M28 family peptidase [Myxococcales bacterium]|nr:M28 family peptidase [Myxococcales bacterium]